MTFSILDIRVQLERKIRVLAAYIDTFEIKNDCVVSGLAGIQCTHRPKDLGLKVLYFGVRLPMS